MIEPGSPAPDFTLRDQDGQEVSLGDLKGQTIVLVFYPLDFSPVCTDQLSIYQELVQDFDSRGVKLYGVSVDSAFAHKAFQEKLNLTFPLLADFEPKGAIAKAYGVYNDDFGTSQRALVMIDPDGIVKWAYSSPSPLEIPGANLIFDALEPSAA
ncbi:MAG TPA: redoxin domain-containing protein [Thermoleophilaceae bacterium]|jgi:peroxiredoxin (alkyl hydroperoxide reductase subunit C)